MLPYPMSARRKAKQRRKIWFEYAVQRNQIIDRFVPKSDIEAPPGKQRLTRSAAQLLNYFCYPLRNQLRIEFPIADSGALGSAKISKIVAIQASTLFRA